MRRSDNWVVLFSQSGREIADLVKKVGCLPYLVLTNNLKPETYSKEFIELSQYVPMITSKHDDLMSILRFSTDEDTSVFTNINEGFFTLHGYLRILPADVCESCEIYNGHPGLITKYPELKGKDPQEKVINSWDKYNSIGSVVHKCTADLDGGEIVSVSESAFGITDVKKEYSAHSDTVYNKLRTHSLDAWTTFLKGRV